MNPERNFHGEKKGQFQKASRIDFALVSAGLDQNILYVPSFKTDHRALYMVVDTSQNERGKGFWKNEHKVFEEEKVC